MHVDVKPEHLMEKVLFATDELTGLIGAAALMRPSKSVQDMELKSLKKKYKSKGFAAGCSREVIELGAEMLGWPLDDVLQKTIDAMKDCEESVAKQMEAMG
jgi:predicted hydrolase (HD superfamily)